ncbi:hypothetical protein [Sphingomonas sp.]|uniref:hypothetical protein n=1 Tax=Sphingomonas sp. TaxID=28214 RepID=UPI002E37967F|nr:hypothetical protein [Sphingomonas sp.]HEX4693675.1 hypothetical protein [Sphingomonas sp.]
MAKLKVFRTPIGFHDAYVAAPSRKAALEAWGSDKNLFARGMAEVVTDPALTKEPLAEPGKVIKRSRGSDEEQLAALGPSKGAGAKKTKPAKPAAPRPSREPLDAAEAAAAEAEKRQQAELRKLDAEIAAIEKRRRALAKEHEAETATLEKQRATREASYRRAMEKWRGE